LISSFVGNENAFSVKTCDVMNVCCYCYGVVKENVSGMGKVKVISFVMILTYGMVMESACERKYGNSCRLVRHSCYIRHNQPVPYAYIYIPHSRYIIYI
jgi:hypothetical protein